MKYVDSWRIWIDEALGLGYLASTSPEHSANSKLQIEQLSTKSRSIVINFWNSPLRNFQKFIDMDLSLNISYWIWTLAGGRPIIGIILATGRTARYSYSSYSSMLAPKAIDQLWVYAYQYLNCVADFYTDAFHSAFNNPNANRPLRESLECLFIAFRDWILGSIWLLRAY